MEQQTHDAYVEKSKGVDDERVKILLDALTKHVETAEPQYLYVRDEEAFRQFVELAGHDAIEGSKIIAYRYSSTTEEFSRENMDPKLSGTWSIIEFHEYLGDFGTMLEFPNDFIAQCIVEIDASSVMYYQHELSSIIAHCDDCKDLEEYDRMTGWNRDHSCEHMDDSYSSRDSITIMSRPDKSQIKAIFDSRD